ncbi:MAG: UDP-N-acetylmuramate dehydrogenase [Planctomycetes bacterium]|nr:UDP-N-acetylmuramate dehydrogenase [Planctomycetota bacterium]
MSHWLFQLPRRIASKVRQDFPLAPLTTFRIGGNADAYLQVSDGAETAQVVGAARQAGIPLAVIGGGSNLLVPDEGIRGLVLDLAQLKSIHADGKSVRVEAGVKLTKAITWTVNRGLAGLEGLAAIPGTIGGALAMNAGGRYGEIGDFVASVETISPKGGMETLDAEYLRFGYRHTQLDGHIVTAVNLRLGEGDAGLLKATMARISREKLAAQPYEKPSAGCIFTNPTGSELSAGRLVDQSGLKGLRRGDAQISEKHGNFIVNLGKARATDVEDLILEAKRRVFERFGIELKTEVRRWAA